jgi:hypothetical protein
MGPIRAVCFAEVCIQAVAPALLGAEFTTCGPIDTAEHCCAGAALLSTRLHWIAGHLLSNYHPCHCSMHVRHCG